MKYGRIAGHRTSRSRGWSWACDNQTHHAARGGHVRRLLRARRQRVRHAPTSTAAATARRLLGQWVKNRGIREQVVILDKGAHTPYCTPDRPDRAAAREPRPAADGLRRHLHDAPRQPGRAGRRVRRRAERAQAGRPDAGLRRVELDARADRGGQRLRQDEGADGLRRGQQQLQPGADGRGPVGRLPAPRPTPSAARGFTKTQMAADALVEPGARLLHRTAPGRTTGPTRNWSAAGTAEDNFQRLARAKELAREARRPADRRSRWPTCCASRSRPSPLIGPRQLSETRTSFDGLKIQLTPQEVKWLNLE